MWLPVEDNEKNHEIELSTSQRNILCPNCGEPESVEEIVAKIDGHLREKALTLSGVCVVILLVSHIFYFVQAGKILPMPDIIWAIVLTPWIGASAKKAIDSVSAAINKGKE